VIALLLFPYFGVSIFDHASMAERNIQQAQQTRDELRQVVGFSVADEIRKLDELKKSGAISDAEFARLRTKLVQ
jgi:Short C-terminal domain